MKASGFTLVELVVTIVVVGIIAAIVGPRFIGPQTFQTRGYFDQVQSGLRYAQKTAVAKRRNICVSIAANSVTFSYAALAGSTAACTLPLEGPAGETPFSLNAPTGVALASPINVFTFEGLGRTNLAATLAISVIGDVTRAITVEAETGYVH